MQELKTLYNLAADDSDAVGFSFMRLGYSQAVKLERAGMKKIDAAKIAFDAVKAFADENAATIKSGSEADARIQLIDRILIEVLGWQRENIKTEPYTGSGYIDYLLRSGGRNVFIVEAKKAGHSLVSTKAPGFAYYKVGGPALRDSSDGLVQAARYCSAKSVAFTALTNGNSWAGFRPVRVDGVSYEDGVAAVFPDLDAVAGCFAEFYDLFSQEGVLSRLYNIYLDREEGAALSPTDPLTSVIPVADIHLTKKSELGSRLITNS